MKINLNEYLILRIPAVSLPDPEKSRSRTKGGGTMARVAGKVGLRFDTAQLSKKEIKDLPRDPSVGSVTPIMPMKLHEPVKKEAVQPADEENVTWGVKAVGAGRSSFSGRGVKVAVLDTGIDADHSAFTGVEILQKDFTGEDDGDKNGHGTHVAGTIFGQAVDGLRIGVAPGIDQALVGKVLGAQGDGSTKSIALAIEWAINKGANVISMSLGMDFPGLVKTLVDSGLPLEPATSQALESYRANVNLFNTLGTLAQRSGDFFQATIILAATGNESRRDAKPGYEIAAAPPSAAEGISAIGALGRGPGGLVVAPFSNTKPDIAAPGVDVISARSGGGLIKLSGTSMATPHAAGVAALWAEKLTRSMGSLSAKALSANLIAKATLDPLKEGFDGLDVGMGIVQSPRK
jgi:subtilisin family serine protease